MTLSIINPECLGAPKGWSNGILAPAGGRMLFVAGQIASDETGRVDGSLGLVDQFAVALGNVLAVVRGAGGGPEDLARLMIYLTDMDAYRGSLKPLGAAYRELMGRHFPTMALVEVNSLVDGDALVEIEATAVLASGDRPNEG